MSDGAHIGERIVGGRFRLTSWLAGGEPRGVARVEDDGGRRFLATVSSAQARPFDQLRTELALPHPRVAPLVYLGAIDAAWGAPWDVLVEEEPAGRSAREAPPEVGEAVAWARQVGVIVAAIHDAGSTLGSLRPEGVFVLDGTVTLAPRAERFWAGARPGDVGMVPPFALSYQAPELLAAGVPEPASDVFSLSVMLAEWSSGAHPFARDGAMAHLAAIFNDEPQLGDGALAPLVRAGLAKSPAARPSLAAWLAALG